jgi:hypothetical protein
MLEVRCEEYLAKVRAHADSLGPDIRQQFEEKLKYLETYRNNECTCQLFTDFAPHSFVFHMMKPGKPDEIWFNGGLIFHAARSSGVEFPVLAVTLDPQDKPHWNIHT